MRTELLRPVDRTTFCEWKGRAAYWTVDTGDAAAEAVVWSYPQPTERFAALVDHYAFYAQQMDECSVDGQVVDQRGLVLRRLDHLRRRRPVQGCSRHARLVMEPR